MLALCMVSKLAVVLPAIIAIVLVTGLFIGNSASATFEQCSRDPPHGVNKGKPFLEIWAALCDLEQRLENIPAAKSLIIMGMVSEASEIMATPVPVTVICVPFLGCAVDAPSAQTTGESGVGEGLVLPRDMTITKLVAFLNADTLVCPEVSLDLAALTNDIATCLTITVQKNGLDTPLVLKVPNCSTAPLTPCKSFGEVDGSVAFAKGDKIRFKAVAAAGGGSTGVYSITVEGTG